MTWALNADVGDSTRKLVLIGYANHAHKDGRNSWASKETIAEYVNCSAKTVRRHVAALIAEGWIREGDQDQVAHLRADRRPIVYDLAMTKATRREWAAEARGDNLTGRESERPDTAVTGRDDTHGGTDGGSPVAARGDTAVSPEPRTNQGTSPLPPPAGATSCAKPGPTPHVNCRGCGTTNRQLEAQRKRDAAEAERLAEAERRESERRHLALVRRPADDLDPELRTDLRRTIRAARSPR